LTPDTGSTTGARLGLLYAAAYEVLPEPTLLLDDQLGVRAANLAARRELGPIESLAGVRCCDVLGCGTPCPARLARDGARRVRGTREAEGPDAPAREILAVPLEAEPGVLVQLREATGGARPFRAPPAGVRIHVLGPVIAERGGEPVGGDWLDHRPGEVFKYLVCARGRTVSSEELLDALWPHAGRSAIGNVRQTVHLLRTRLEAGFGDADGARLIASRRGGYTLNQPMCTVDADEFEQAAVAALAAAGGEGRGAAPSLSRAADLYSGDLLAETPYADWAFAERDRLRSLAARVLWELAEIELDAGDLAGATRCLYRLAGLEPLELRPQQRLLAVLVRRGQHSEAGRQFDAFRARYRRAFGQDPDFTLADVS
jgi:DNA-binding SARP family transcriptional activator